MCSHAAALLVSAVCAVEALVLWIKRATFSQRAQSVLPSPTQTAAVRRVAEALWGVGHVHAGAARDAETLCARLAFLCLVAGFLHLRIRPLAHPGDLAAISNRPRVLSTSHVMTTPAMHACISAPTAAHVTISTPRASKFLFPSRSTHRCRHETDRRAAFGKSFIGPQVPSNNEKPGSSSAHRADEVSAGVCVPSLLERVARLTYVAQRGAGNLLLA